MPRAILANNFLVSYILILFYSPKCSWNKCKIWETREIFLILHSALWDNNYLRNFEHSHKKRKDSLETPAEPTVIPAYVENLVILEPILLYCASKFKQTQKQGSRTVYRPTFWPFCEIIINFLLSRDKKWACQP